MGKDASRKMSKLLRHEPEDLVMDDRGWVSVQQLISKLGITKDDLQVIVDTNDKKRFTLSDDGTMIRAAQGHTAGVASKVHEQYARLTATQADFDLYHGTVVTMWEKIHKGKILTGKREFVHWTSDRALAEKRAKQKAGWNKSEPVLVILKAKSYIHGGGVLYMAENGVYLTPEINGEILKHENI